VEQSTTANQQVFTSHFKSIALPGYSHSEALLDLIGEQR